MLTKKAIPGGMAFLFWCLLRFGDLLALAGFAGGHLAIEFGGAVAGDAEGLPAVAGEVLGEKDDLADVVRVMRELAIDGLHHGVGFAADGDGAGEVGSR